MRLDTDPRTSRRRLHLAEALLDAWTVRRRAAIEADGRLHLSGTRVGGREALAPRAGAALR